MLCSTRFSVTIEVGACCSPEKFRKIIHNPPRFTNSPWNSGAAAASVVKNPCVSYQLVRSLRDGPFRSNPTWLIMGLS